MTSLRQLHGRGMNNLSNAYSLPADDQEHDVCSSVNHCGMDLHLSVIFGHLEARRSAPNVAFAIWGVVP